MPLFIQRPDDPELPPPYSFPGVTIHSFELEADPGKLQQLCDALLNIGNPADRGFEYRPLLPYVALEVLYYPKMVCTSTPFSNWGYVSQNEAYIRFPVVKYESLGFLLLPMEVSNFFPFLVVDSAWSAFSGRNVIGFPKVIGTITQQTARNTSYSASVKVPVFRQLSPQTIQTSEEIIRIQTGARAARAARAGRLSRRWPWAITSPGGLITTVESLLLEMLELIDPDLFSTIQLKQFRDAEDPTQACFQGLVHSAFEVENVSEPQFFDEASVTLSSFGSLDMVGDLGLSATNPIKPALAYYTTCDMTFGDTTNMFINTN
jgi:hypothetical protein